MTADATSMTSCKDGKVSTEEELAYRIQQATQSQSSFVASETVQNALEVYA